MTDAQKAQIERINELSLLARTAWFSLLAYLGFVGITLLGVEDADFFVPSRQTQLPLVNVQIPTASFFWTAPILGAALYTYLHLFLIKLWEAHGTAQTTDADPTHHWLVNDFVLIRQGDPTARARPLAWLTSLVTRLLVWAAGPIVLAGLWWRSMPAHDEWMTLLIAICLGITLYAGFTSWWSADASLRHPWRTPWQGWWKIPMATLAGLLIVATSWLRTEGGFDHTVNRLINLANSTFETNLLKDCPKVPAELAADTIDPCFYGNGDPRPSSETQELRVAERVLTLDDLTFNTKDYLALRWIDDDDTWSTLARTNLAGVEMVALPDDWRTLETARLTFRETWCKREGLDIAICDHLPHADRPNPPYLAADRLKWCGDHGLDDGACTDQFDDLDRQFTAAWDEERGSATGNLTKLDLSGRDLRRAQAPGVTLVGANLKRARLEGANLIEARLEGANLEGARLEGAILIAARLEGGLLTLARLEGTYLGYARLEGAALGGARLEGADLQGARLEGANLGGARLEGANLGGAQLEGASLVQAQLEGANLDHAGLEGATLIEARLEGADLGGARLEGANLGGAFLRYADFRKSNWAGASNRASPAEFADFRGAQGLMQAQLEGLIGNDGTLLPDGPSDTGAPWYVWSCWEQPPARLDRIVAAAAGPFADDVKRGALRAEFLCGPGNPRRKTGTPLALDAPYPEGHPLAGRD